MSDLLTRMNNAVTRANLAATTTFNVLTGDENAIVQVQGETVPTLTKRMRDYVNLVVGSGSLNGADGDGIAEMYVNVDGDLMVRLTSQLAAVNLGRVKPVDGDGISNVAIDALTGHMTITLTNGAVIPLGKVTGDDAPTISNAYIENSNLIIKTSDNQIFNAGDISIFGGVSVNFVDLSEAGDLVVIFSDGTITNLGHVIGAKGDTGRSIISGYVDAANNLVFLKNDGSQVNVGAVSVKVPDANSVVVESAKLGGVDGKDLILTLSTGDVNVGRVVGEDGLAGLDGVGVESVTLNAEGMLVFTMSDASTTTVGPILNIDATEGSIFLTNASVTESGELELTVNANGTITTINVGNVKGKDGLDGAVVSSAKIDPVTSELTFHGADDVLMFSAGVIEQNSITAATLSPEGHLVLTLTDGTEVDSGADIRGTAGIDGIGVTGAYIDAKGHLFFSFDAEGMADADIGKITAPVETAVELVDKQLTITLSDGQVFGPFNIGGVDGQFMTAAKIVNGELVVTLSEDGDVNLGSIEKNPTGLSFNETGGLRVTFSDETFVETLERVQGLDGNTINSITIDVLTKELVISTSVDDGVTTNELRIPQTVGKSITSVDVDTNDLLVYIDNSLEPVRVAIPKGVDGNTITDINFSGGNLNIVTSGAPDVPVVIPAVQGKTIETAVVRGDDLVFTVSEQEPELVFPTIRGIDAVESIRDVSFDVAAGSLIIEMVDDSRIVIENAKGIDGITIDRIYIGMSKELIIETSDGGLYQFPYLEGRNGDTILDVKLNVARDLEISYDIEGVQSTVTIEAVKGRDGDDAKTILSALIDEQKQLVIEMSDASTITIPGVGASVSAIEVIQATGLLKITLDDGSEFTSTESIRGRDGFGTGVKNVEYNASGNLIITLSDIKDVESTVDAGKVEVVTITNAEMIEGDLVLTFSDGRAPVNVGRIMGKDGRHVSTAEINAEEHLILNMSDGSVIDAGSSKGKNGRSVTSVDVIATNELVVQYDDDTVQVVGNIGGSDDLTLWETGIPYSKDRVVIHLGSLYISTIDRNSNRPPHASWKAIAFGDYIVEVRKPVAKFPIGGESGLSNRPTFEMSLYAPLVSSDELDYRELQVYVTAPTALTYTRNIKSTSKYHTVEADIPRSGTFKWRFRDVTVNGAMSEWSEEQTFTTPAETLLTPTININEYENALAALPAPQFETSAFDDVTAQLHVSTDWEVRLVSDDTVVYSEIKNTTDKLKHIIPFGTLIENTDYKVRARHNGGTLSSNWTEWLEFTTEAVFGNYIETPAVVYLGDDPQSIESFPEFAGTKFRKTDRFLGVSENVSMGLVSADWEVVNADTGVDYEVVNKKKVGMAFKANLQWMNETNYRVRVKYNSDRFGSSEMSPWFEGKSVVNVTTPVLTTLEDVLNFPATGIVSGGEFTAVNETHVSTDWELRDSLTDEVVWSRIDNKIDLTEIVLKIPYGYNDNDLKFRVKYNAVNVESEWSAYMDLHAIDHYRGVGNVELIGGDTSAGFFGEVPASELFTGTELSGLIGLSAGTNVNSNEPWLKFIIDGEIIYVAKKHYKNSVSWNHINAANAVYDDETSKIVSKDGNDYRVTLIRGANTDPSGASGPHDLSEWDRLMYKVSVNDPEGTPWASYTDIELDITGAYTWCQETSTTNRVVRGYASLVYFYAPAPAYFTSSSRWRPALRGL